MKSVLIIMFIAQVAGFVSYGTKFPNGNAYPQYPALGHLDDAGVTGENEFGKDYVPVWAGKYCNTDSDGDGYTNGQELGDPCCEWTSAADVVITVGISHPGLKDSIPTNPKLLKKCATAIKGNNGPVTIADDDEDDSSESAPTSSSSQVQYGLWTIALSAITLTL